MTAANREAPLRILGGSGPSVARAIPAGLACADASRPCDRPNQPHISEIPTRHPEPHRLGAGGKQQRIKDNATAVHELQVPALRIKRGDGRVQLQVDAVLQVERRRAQGLRGKC